MLVKIISYGSKNGNLTPHPHFLFECRNIPNPHTQGGILKELDGTTRIVQTWVMGWPQARDILESAERAVAKGLHPTFNGPHFSSDDPPTDSFTVAFECIGGKHRSAALAETLGAILTKRGIAATVTHRDL